MVDKICDHLTNKIKQTVPDINDEKAEIINYGIHLIVGEIPKTFIFIGLAAILGILKEFFLTILIIFPYRAFSGGFHLKTHLGCIVGTSSFYCGIPYIAKMFSLDLKTKIICTILTWIFGIIMCKLYAPADTENVPILRKKDRRKKQICSYIILTITLAIGLFINNSLVSNIIILGMFGQTLLITRLAYKITNNKYGYEVYLQEQKI
jgi:accessory gene regulator B